MEWKDFREMNWVEEVVSICNASCEHMDHMSRESCPCGYCRIRMILYDKARNK